MDGRSEAVPLLQHCTNDGLSDSQPLFIEDLTGHTHNWLVTSLSPEVELKHKVHNF